ncbi:hypothetical protein [Streptomyces sp. NPDC050538]|uniref:hypothetical protein n=1 Tax=Streptomyces sp. NPDC050538 TaxID=3365627 RepID=UPI0037A03F52
MGGASGIGRAVARMVVEGGGGAVVTGRPQASVDQAASALSAHGHVVGPAADLAAVAAARSRRS